MAFCRQIPGWEPYEQAGQRFSAGDRAGAVRLVTQAAEAGNPLAQLRLAMLYEAGDGVARDKTRTSRSRPCSGRSSNQRS